MCSTIAGSVSVMRDTIADVEPLDNPVWHALTGNHSRFADGDGRARRYKHDVAPFAALPAHTDAQAWGSLATPTGTAGTLVDIRPPGVVPLPVSEVLGTFAAT